MRTCANYETTSAHVRSAHFLRGKRRTLRELVALTNWSPPIGNASLIDGRSACPDKCLVGCTNAVLWTKSAGEIITQIERDLAALPHHRGLVITSGGVMPPMCEPETIREVCQWLRRYRVLES